MGVKSATEDVLMETMQRVKTACLSNQMMHTSHCFTGDPENLAIVTCFTVCPDDIAKELHVILDATVKSFMAKHRIHIR